MPWGHWSSSLPWSRSGQSWAQALQSPAILCRLVKIGHAVSCRLPQRCEGQCCPSPVWSFRLQEGTRRSQCPTGLGCWSYPKGGVQTRPSEWNGTCRASPASQLCSRRPEDALWKDRLNKIFKAEVYSDCTDELLKPGTQEFKFIPFFFLSLAVQLQRGRCLSASHSSHCLLSQKTVLGRSHASWRRTMLCSDIYLCFSETLHSFSL